MPTSRYGARGCPGGTAAPMTGATGPAAGPAAGASGRQDWRAWHDGYDVPGSLLARRLAAVQGRIRLALDSCPPGPLRAVSICAGQGRDLLGVLASHPRRHDVAARLVELDPRNAAIARDAARAAGLGGVEVVVGDASRTDHYVQLVPADLVLACGIFGNVTAADIERTVAFLGCMTATGGTVIWTRHRREPDLIPELCRWFEQGGFELEWVSDPGEDYGVGAHRFAATPRPLEPGASMFTFVGRERLRELEPAAERLRASSLPGSSAKHRVADRPQVRFGVRAHHEQRRDRALSPQFEPFADPPDGAEQAHPVREFIGHGGEGLVAAALEEQFLDLAAGLLESHPADHVEVEVPVPRAHAADVETDHHLRGPQRGGEVVGEDDADHGGDVEARRCRGECAAVDRGRSSPDG